MRRIFTILTLSLLVFGTSCATLLTGTQQRVSIDSNPQGADIIIDGQKLGVTPSKVKVDRDLNALLEDGKEIELEMQGYRKNGYVLDATINPIVILNTVNLMFWGIDIITGAVTKYDNYYTFELIPFDSNVVTPDSKKEDDKYDKLIKLKKLLDDGVITQEEFEKEKAKILEE